MLVSLRQDFDAAALGQVPHSNALVIRDAQKVFAIGMEDHFANPVIVALLEGKDAQGSGRKGGKGNSDLRA